MIESNWTGQLHYGMGNLGLSLSPGQMLEGLLIDLAKSGARAVPASVVAYGLI